MAISPNIAAAPDPAAPIKLIKLAQVKGLVPHSTTEIYRRIAAGTFPKQVRLGPKSVAWVESEILEYCKNLADQRGEAA